MSGIYIPGVEKPKSQEQCKFFDYAPFRADYCVLFSTCKGVKDCPIIEVEEQKHGTWMPIIEANEFGDAYQCGCYCSECGEELQSEPNYCPNCGARMDGE